MTQPRKHLATEDRQQKKEQNGDFEVIRSRGTNLGKIIKTAGQQDGAANHPGDFEIRKPFVIEHPVKFQEPIIPNTLINSQNKISYPVNMITSATVQSAIVLMNRRMKAERGVIMFVPVCSRVAGMPCIISEERIRRKRRRAAYKRNTTPAATGGTRCR